ncbi:MAG: formylglycine-generating enzyme family protein, partial [Bacteroidetes bacterium]
MIRSLLFCTVLILSLHARAQAQPPVLEETIPGTEQHFRLVLVPGGEFQMGSPPDEEGRREDEGPRRRVRVDSFWMGVHEVTYDLFILFQD